MVIEIKIKAIGDKVFDKLIMRETRLSENAVVIRRLEEIKLKLLAKNMNQILR